MPASLAAGREARDALARARRVLNRQVVMKILVVGAAGVLGRATLPHLREHDVVGTTRSVAKREVLAALGARAEIADVYEPGAVERVARAFMPDVVVNFLTDLAGGRGPANSRI